MALQFDAGHDRYAGERLTVSGALFRAAIDDLVAGGMPEEDVLATLLEEEGWSPEMLDVVVLDRKQWAPTLWFDFDCRSFVGPRLSVDVRAFYRRLRGPTASRADPAGAYNDLRQESAWSLSMAGVTRAFNAGDVVADVERLLRQRAL